jgi:uncharacterized membrane protein YhaH (DUF805 family)
MKIVRQTMNLFEAGTIPGVITGAIAGGVLCKSYGVLAVIGGSLSGAICGGVIGFLYAAAVIILMAIIGMLWTAVRKRSNISITDNEQAQMSEIARPGTFLGVLIGALLIMNWLDALIAMAVMAIVIATVAVTVQQFRDRAKPHY